MRRLAPLVLLALLAGCPASPPAPNGPPPPPTDDRRPAVSPSDPQYDRVEGAGFANACASDADCFKGGCSSEVCSAAQDVVTTCELPVDGFPGGEGCGCVQGQCVWYEGPDAGPPAPPAPEGAAQGMPCEDGRCAEGLACVEYYGIAGPSGPRFSSCEISCLADDGACPDGQACVTIADGPGRVCRPQEVEKTVSDPALPARGEACLAGACAEGLTCVEYYGIAGAKGPRFTSCETPCKGGKGCPSGTSCTMIADGPGQVCR